MGYSKAETEKKQRKLVSKTQRNTRKVLVILFKIILVGIIAVIIAGAGAGFGMMKGILTMHRYPVSILFHRDTGRISGHRMAR